MAPYGIARPHWVGLYKHFQKIIPDFNSYFLGLFTGDQTNESAAGEGNIEVLIKS